VQSTFLERRGLEKTEYFINSFLDTEKRGDAVYFEKITFLCGLVNLSLETSNTKLATLKTA